MKLSRKNIKDIKTTIIGSLLIATALCYLFVLEKESYTIFFGTMLLGVVFIVAPDSALTNLNLFFKRFLSGFGSETHKINNEVNEDVIDEEKEIPPGYEK